MEIAALRLCSALASRVDVALVVHRKVTSDVREQAERILGEAVLIDALSRRGLRSLVGKADAAIFVGLWSVARLRPRRFFPKCWIWWEHSLTHERYANNLRVRLLWRASSIGRGPTHVVAPSETVSAFLSGRLQSEVEVIPNLLDGYRSDVMPVAPPNIIADGQYRPRDSCATYVIGALCRLEPERRLHIAIECLPLLPSDVHLVIAGDGSSRRSLEQLVSVKGLQSRVRFVGWIDDADRFLDSIDLLVSTAPSETFGYSLFESAEAGTPVVCLPNQTVGDLVPRLIPGRICSSDSPASLSAEIRWLRSNPPSRTERDEARALREQVLDGHKILESWVAMFGRFKPLVPIDAPSYDR